MHARDLDQEAGAERRVEVGDADAALVLGLPQVGPRGRRRLDLVGVVGEADDLEERSPGPSAPAPRRSGPCSRRLLATGYGSTRSWSIATSAGPGSCSITSIGGLARAAFTLAIWSTDSIGSSAMSALLVGLAEGRHQHVAVRLLPAAGEGREHEAAWPAPRSAREKLHGAERERARHQAAAGEGSWFDSCGCRLRGRCAEDRDGFACRPARTRTALPALRGSRAGGARLGDLDGAARRRCAPRARSMAPSGRPISTVPARPSPPSARCADARAARTP